MDTPASSPTDSFATDGKWPLKSLLILGYFGNKSPEGRRYHNRCVGAFVALIVASILWTWVAATLWRDGPVDRMNSIAGHVIAGSLFSFIAWSFWQYLKDLDELARGIQLQAISLTYLSGLGGMGFLGALVGVNNPWLHSIVTDPIVTFILLEPVRGLWLWIIARRYR